MKLWIIKKVFRVAHSTKNQINKYLLGQALYYRDTTVSWHQTRLRESDIYTWHFNVKCKQVYNMKRIMVFKRLLKTGKLLFPEITLESSKGRSTKKSGGKAFSPGAVSGALGMWLSWALGAQWKEQVWQTQIFGKSSCHREAGVTESG